MASPRVLAGIGIALQYATQIPDLTARELAAFLINSIENNDTSVNGVALLAAITENPNITNKAAIGLLEGFSNLTTAKRNHATAPWWFLLVFTFVLLMVRLYSRHIYRDRIRSDDWVMCLGWMFASGFTADAIWLVYNARLDYHVWDTSLADIKMHALLAFCDKFLNLFALLCVKASLLLFYYQISPAWPKSRNLIHFSFFMIITYHIICLILMLVACYPLDSWNNLLTVKCRLNTFAYYMFLTVYSVVTDLLILIVPMLITWRLNLGLRDKTIVMGLFGLGILASITGVIKATTLRALTHSTDLSWDSVPTTNWTIVEMYIPVICSSVPALRNLLLHYFPNALGPRTVLPVAENDSETPSNNMIDYDRLLKIYAEPRSDRQLEMDRTSTTDRKFTDDDDDLGSLKDIDTPDSSVEQSTTDLEALGGLRATPPRIISLGRLVEALERNDSNINSP